MDKKRSKSIVRAGYYFIITNFLLGIFNIIVGILSGSVAITSDATHSFIDSISGFLVIISEKISSHDKYSAKRDQIERFTTVLIAIIIIATGVHFLIESIEGIIESEVIDYDAPTIIVVIVSFLAKLALTIYLRTSGKKHHSDVLLASGAETFNDTLISLAVLVSIIISLIWHVNIEGHIGIIISVIILKIGLEFIFPHISHHHHHPLETNPDHDHCGKHNQPKP
ncbi:cation diffusion facilitator family transporter [Candidatus Saccharibacteria bacterium]|nr:cation diffusion facilitator family transporter [Candidatus Saccharibacteria bacterium]